MFSIFKIQLLKLKSARNKITKCETRDYTHVNRQQF